MEGGQRFVVVDGDVLRPPRFLEPSVFRADAGIIQPGRNRMRLRDLPVRVAHHISAVTVQHADRCIGGERRGVFARFDAMPARLNAIERDRVVIKRIKEADGIRAATDTGDDRIGQRAKLRLRLRLRLLADDLLKIAHQLRVGVRAGGGADDIKRVVHIRRPVAQRLVQRILERAAARRHRDDRRAEQFHPVHIRRLALHIIRAHIDDTFQAEAGGNRRARHAVLTRAGFRNHARLAEADGQERLTDGIVNLVRAGVVQILALQPNLRAACLLRQAFGEIQRRRAADIISQLRAELRPKSGVILRGTISRFQLQHGLHQSLGDKLPAEAAKIATGVRESRFHKHSLRR